MKFGLKKRELTALVLGIVIVLFVINFLSSRHFLRFDLTEGKEYTLSKSTVEILKSLNDVVNIKIYFSKDLPPAVTSLKRDVDDMLSEYRTYAGSRLNVQYVDPQESPQREAEVQMMGIPPLQLNVIQKDKQELVKLYLGIAVIHEDRKEIIPVIQGVGNLEYDLTAAILKVSTKDTPSIAWLTAGDGASYRQIKELLKRRYKIRDVSPGAIDLDPAKDALLIMAISDKLDDLSLFAVDQYLMNGGKIFLMVDQIGIENNLKTAPLDVANILAWLKANKITVEDKLLIDQSNTHAAFSGGYVTYHVPYPFWVKVGRDGFDMDSPMVSDLDSLILPWISPLAIDDERLPGVDYRILARSSPLNDTVGFDASLMPEGTQGFVRTKGETPKPLIVFASGPLVSYFGRGKAETPTGGVDVVEKAKDGQLIVVGDARFIQDNFLRQFGSNSIFFENAVDFMAMGNALIGIRSKGINDRPIENISPAGIALAKYINVIGAPLILVVIGIIIILLRRQKRLVLKGVYKQL